MLNGFVILEAKPIGSKTVSGVKQALFFVDFYISEKILTLIKCGVIELCLKQESQSA